MRFSVGWDLGARFNFFGGVVAKASVLGSFYVCMPYDFTGNKIESSGHPFFFLSEEKFSSTYLAG